MGEVVVSSSSEEEEGMVVEFETEKDIGSSEVVRWEEFLPRMVLSVLLVEADDSTRQIIAALLRKCSYRVAAVPDGLMAWETLKDGHHNIDLILTEVELPSISGYALLTLVMEHDVYKNIPVIMMSSHDSISMVLNCLLKGAADFLIKPVRKNELRNLWQHVWKRQTVFGQLAYTSSNSTGSEVNDHRHGATSNGNQDVTTPILVGNISTGCVHDFSPLYYTQARAAWSPKLSGQQQSPYPLGNSIHSNTDVHDSKKNHRCSDETTCNSADQKNGHQQNNTEPVDQVRHGSAAGQSET